MGPNQQWLTCAVWWLQDNHLLQALKHNHVHVKYAHQDADALFSVWSV